MDVVFSDVLQDLNNFQSKIASLYEDFMKQKVHYSKNIEHLCKNLKESSTEIDKLKKEIEMLRQDNLNMKNVIYKGINFFKNLDFSKTNKQHTNELEALKTIFLEYSSKTENYNLTNTEKKGETMKSCELTEEDIQKEIKLLKSINFCSNLFDDDTMNNDTREDCTLQRSCSEDAYQSSESVKKIEDKFENKKEVTKETLVPRTKSFQLDYINCTVDTEFDKTVELSNENNKSPVFKDFSGRRHCNSSVVEENGSSESRGSIEINETFLQKNIHLDLSSPEKSRRDGSRTVPKSPAQKWVNKSIKIPMQKVPPSNLLKKSNTRDVEKTPSGLKILNQTFLNLERFKRNGPETRKSENQWRPSLDDTVKTSDEEIDDTIIEIPNKADRVLKDIKNKKTSRSDMEEITFDTLPLLEEPDLDETYISSSIIQKHMLEREDQAPLKRHAPQRCEHDIPYKDKPVRKKTERLKLPGHACVECNKYYENALGDIGSEELKKVLNKCSRHRDRYSPSFDDTPPGYWTPFLTCSTVISPNS